MSSSKIMIFTFISVSELAGQGTNISNKMLEQWPINETIRSSLGIPKKRLKCFPNCKYQKNHLSISHVKYPEKKSFFDSKEFCTITSHIWNVTCINESKRHFLSIIQPDLCSSIENYTEIFEDPMNCEHWPDIFYNDFGSINSPDKILNEEMMKYAEENISKVKIFIPRPFITKIKRSIEMTFNSFIANTGGLVGLCLGFSLISGVELFYWVFKLVSRLSQNLTKQSL